jgi:hypothetical protein
MKTYPTIRNCNFSTRKDDTGRHVNEALAAFDRGCRDCDLVGALDELEATLAMHAESTLAEEMEACTDAEEAVEAALLTINAAFEDNDQKLDAVVEAGLEEMHARDRSWLAEDEQEGNQNPLWPI